MPYTRPEIRVTFSPQTGELQVEGNLEAVKRFMEWYLDMVKKLQQAQAQEQKPQKEQRQVQAVEARQEKPKPRQETRLQPASVDTTGVDTTGLPSFVKDNPWIGILSKKY